MSDTTISNLNSVTTLSPDDLFVLDRGDKTYNIKASNLLTAQLSSYNVGTGCCSTIAGGTLNVASGDCSTVGGGQNNSANESYTTVSGGYGNCVNNSNSTISGGYANIIGGINSVVAGGDYNNVDGDQSVISGGEGNYVSNCYSSIGGGSENFSNGNYNTISGGYKNHLICNGDFSTIGGGGDNTVSGYSSTIGGGKENTICKNYSFIGGGNNNFVNSCYSAILGGCNNTLYCKNSFAIGSNIVGTDANTTYVGQNLCVCGNLNASSISNTVITLATALDINADDIYAKNLIIEGGDIFSNNGTSTDWNSVYSTVNANSGSYITTVNGTTNQVIVNQDSGNQVTIGLPTDIVTPGNVQILGNLYVAGSSIAVTTTTLSSDNSILYVGNTNIGNVKDIGLVGHFDNGLYQHTGIARIAKDNKWSLFSGVTAEPDGSLVETDGPTFTIDTLRANIEGTVVGNLTGNVIGNVTGNVVGSLVGNVTGNLTGNADTVTNGVYINQSYYNPTWLLSLNSSKLSGTQVNSWNSVYTQVDSLSSGWSTGSGFQSQSANNQSVYTQVNSLSSGWSTGSGFQSQSANNQSVYTQVNSLSTSWSTGSGFQSQSANNQSVYSNVNTTSANWSSVYSYVFSNSATNNPTYNSTIFTRSSSLAFTLKPTTSAIEPVAGFNTSTGIFSFIAGGSANNATANNTFVLGSNLTTPSTNFTYVNNLSSQGAVCGRFFGDGSNITGLSQTLYVQSIGSCSIIPNNASANVAGPYSLVSSGSGNNALQGNYNIIVGGCANTTGNFNGAFIGGGFFNRSLGCASTISGGLSSTASACYGTIGGGYYNSAVNGGDVVSGGGFNIASGCHSFVGGGRSNTANGFYSNVVGGCGNIASSACSNIIGGRNNIASGAYSFIAGGCSNNTNSRDNTFILGSNITALSANFTYVNNLSSQGNICGNFYGDGSNITGIPQIYQTGSGSLSIQPTFGSNTSSAYATTIGGGRCNNAAGGLSTISGGYKNTIGSFGGYAIIAGGRNNNNTGITSSILGGAFNSVTSDCSSILGGSCNNTNNQGNTFILGSNITALSANFTYVNNLSSQGSINTASLNANNGGYFGNTLTVNGQISSNNTITAPNIFASVGAANGIAWTDRTNSGFSNQWYRNSGVSYFYDNTPTAPNSGNLVAITSAGNVGIGTSTPNRTLTVNGDILSNGNIFGGTHLNIQSGTTYTLQLSDNGTMIGSTNTGAGLSATPSSGITYPIGFQVGVIQLASSKVALSATGSPTINQANGFIRTTKQYSAATLIFTGATGWVAFGDLSS